VKQAIIKIGSRQFSIEEGSVLSINAIASSADIKVLYYTDGKTSYIGTPEVEDVTVKTSLVEEKRGRKIRVGRFRAKSRYDKSKGYRDLITVLKIDKLSHKTEKEAQEVKEPVEKKITKKKVTKKKA